MLDAKSKFSKLPFFRLCSMALLVSAFAIYGCNSGDTDGGEAVDRVNDDYAEIGSQQFSGNIEIELLEDDPGLGNITGFFVRATDANGLPLDFVRIACDTENGVNIVEPNQLSALTDSTGVMSGKLCGNSPGSFQIECRAPVGFGLVARDTIIIRGATGDGFEGCPGTPGQLPGGGFVDLGSIRLTSILFSNNPGGNYTPNGPLDVRRNLDCDGDGQGEITYTDPVSGEVERDETPADDFEPIALTRAQITVQNQLLETFTIESVEFQFLNAPGGLNDFSTGPINVASTVAGANNGGGNGGGSTQTINVLLENQANFIRTAIGIRTGGVVRGAYDILVIVNGTRAATREREQFQAYTTLSLDDVDNCS